MIHTEFMKGVIVPILTPIDEEERIDEAKLREQVDYVIEGGVLGILAFGSNGEFYVIEEDEMKRGLKIMEDPYTLASVQSVQRNAAVWQRWPLKMVQQAFPSFSPCF